MDADYFTFYQSNVKGIKQSGSPKQFTGLCPWHEDSSPSFSFNTESGLSYCHAGCGSFNPYTFSKRLGIDTKPFSNSTYPQNGITTDYVAKNNKNGHIRDTMTIELKPDDKNRAMNYHKYLLNNFDELTKELPWAIESVKKTFTGFDSKTGRFVFLHTNNQGKGINLKWHKGKDGEQPFSMPGHGQCRLYPLNLLKNYNPTLPLIFCEGEKDLVTLLSYAFQAVTSTTGAASFPDLTPLIAFKRIIVLYDKDPSGIKGGRELGKALKQQFSESQITLISWESERPLRWDVTDHFSQDKDRNIILEEFDRILNTGIEIEIPQPKKKGYSVMKAGAFETSSYKKPEPIVEEILTEYGYGTIAGSDGVGKSFLALQFALSCALGVPFLDYKTTRGYKVLFIQFELDNGELLFRYKKMVNWYRKTYHNPPGKEDNLFISTLESDTLIFSNQWKKIESTIKEVDSDIDVLIVDNLYTSTNVDVSNPHQLSPLLGDITRIAKKYNLAIMLVNHHTKKLAEVKKLDKDMIRGGKNFTDWLTNAVQIADSSLSQDLRVFKITKQRSGNGFTRGIPQALRFDTDNLIFHRLGVIEREELHFIDPKTKPEFDAIRKVTPYADKDGIFTTDQFIVVVEEMKYKRKTAFNWLGKLEKWKVIQKLSHGNYTILKSELDKYSE